MIIMIKTVYFKRQTNGIVHKMICTWLSRGNLKRETISLLITEQNVMRTNYIKAKIDDMQNNSKGRLCEKSDETVNHLISEYSNLAQKEYKNRHDWVGKVIHRKLCKRLKLDQAEKWYKNQNVWENETQKILWDFEIQTNHPILTRKPPINLMVLPPTGFQGANWHLRQVGIIILTAWFRGWGGGVLYKQYLLGRAKFTAWHQRYSKMGNTMGSSIFWANYTRVSICVPPPQ